MCRFRETTFELLGGVTELNFNFLNLGDDGAVQLAVVLPLCAKLTELKLVGTQLGDKGAAALAGAIKGNGALTKLVLEGNQIGDTGMTGSELRAFAESEKAKAKFLLGQAQGERAAASAELAASRQTIARGWGKHNKADALWEDAEKHMAELGNCSAQELLTKALLEHGGDMSQLSINKVDLSNMSTLEGACLHMIT